MSPCPTLQHNGINVSPAVPPLRVQVGVDGGAEDPGLRPFWRGRMGLSREEQQELYEAGGSVEELLLGAAEEEGEGGADGGDSEEEAAVLEAAVRERQWQRWQDQMRGLAQPPP